jgi:hypothetical protein
MLEREVKQDLEHLRLYRDTFSSASKLQPCFVQRQFANYQDPHARPMIRQQEARLLPEGAGSYCTCSEGHRLPRAR